MSKTAARNQDTAEATKLGAAAFVAGIVRAPAVDHAINAMLVGRTSKDQCRLMTAWLSGWTRASLAAVAS